MSKKEFISLNEKIEIFERFNKTGRELIASTIFEGYPIGQWAITIRNLIKKGERLKPTEEQLGRLAKLGILERKIDSTIDEKIDVLVEWKKRNPQEKLVRNKSVAENKEDEEYQKIQLYYNYIRERKGQGKLSQEQIKKCKDGNIGGVFGYSTEVEKLAKKYGHNEEDINGILTKYDSLKNFIELSRDDNILYEEDKMLGNKNFIKNVDFDFNPNSSCYGKLLSAINEEYGKTGNLIFYSSNKLQEALKNLKPREKNILEERYGLLDGEFKSLKKVGKKFNITYQRIGDIESNALKNLRNSNKRNKLFVYLDKDSFLDSDRLSDNEKIIVQELYDSDLSFYSRTYQLSEADVKSNPNILKAFEIIKEWGLEGKNYNLDEKNVKIEKNIVHELEEMNFSTRAYKALKYGSGIHTLEGLTKYSESEILRIRKIGAGTLQEIKAKLEEYGLSFREDENKKLGKKDYNSNQTKNDDLKSNNTEEGVVHNLDELDISTRAFKALKYGSGIHTLEELTKYSESEILRIRKIGIGTLQEIKAKLEEYGLSFREEENQKLEKDYNSNNAKNDKTSKRENLENKMSIIEKLEAERAELEVYLKVLDKKTVEARKLLEHYNKLLGKNKDSRNDGSPEFKGE